MPREKDKYTICEVEERAIKHVESLLFEGNPLGGSSLRDLLDRYAAQGGPFSPLRYGLVVHLQRCLEALIEMDAIITTRAKTTNLTPLRLRARKSRKHTPDNPNACPVCSPGRCEVARRRELRKK